MAIARDTRASLSVTGASAATGDWTFSSWSRRLDGAHPQDADDFWRTFSARLCATAYIGGRAKVNMGPWEPGSSLPTYVVVIEELNRHLASNGFPDFEAVHDPIGELRLVWRPET